MNNFLEVYSSYNWPFHLDFHPLRNANAPYFNMKLKNLRYIMGYSRQQIFIKETWMGYFSNQSSFEDLSCFRCEADSNLIRSCLIFFLLAVITWCDSTALVEGSPLFADFIFLVHLSFIKLLRKEVHSSFNSSEAIFVCKSLDITLHFPQKQDNQRIQRVLNLHCTSHFIFLHVGRNPSQNWCTVKLYCTTSWCTASWSLQIYFKGL